LPNRTPVNLHHIIQDTVQIFHIDRRKPSDLEPAYIRTSSMYSVTTNLVHMGALVYASLTLLIACTGHASYPPRSEEFHLNRKVFEWVPDEIDAKFNQSLVDLGETCGTI
ncbi:hypothetical protein BKA83DRAFT_3998843, partial [Pisolithus microcarpus]